jgi:hypothetical protein
MTKLHGRVPSNEFEPGVITVNLTLARRLTRPTKRMLLGRAIIFACDIAIANLCRIAQFAQETGFP